LLFHRRPRLYAVAPTDQIENFCRSSLTVIACSLLSAGVGVWTGSTEAGVATAGVCTGVGLAIHHYRSEQSRSSSEDQHEYGGELGPDATAPVVHIRRVVSPRQARPGGTVTVATDYSLSVPATIPSVEVTEGWVVKKDGKALKTLEPHREQRGAGGWYAEAEIELPADMPPGTYTVEHRVSAGGRTDVTTSTFVVS
jgi:hypothetical protein